MIPDPCQCPNGARALLLRSWVFPEGIWSQVTPSVLWDMLDTYILQMGPYISASLCDSGPHTLLQHKLTRLPSKVITIEKRVIPHCEGSKLFYVSHSSSLNEFWVLCVTQQSSTGSVQPTKLLPADFQVTRLCQRCLCVFCCLVNIKTSLRELWQLLCDVIEVQLLGAIRKKYE